MKSGGASRTAVFVCQGRAVADGLHAVGSFSDPIAARMLTEDELGPVRLARSGRVPSGGRERFLVEAVASCAEVVTPRTVLIDTALTAALDRAPGSQVVILGAGLDARPWRLLALTGLSVLSVDHPASQADAHRRTASLTSPVCELRFVPVDLSSEPLGPALSAVGHDATGPTVWVWEGVIPYLTHVAVGATIEALTRVSGSGSCLIANYQAPSLAASLGRRAVGLVTRMSGIESPLADEPWQSLWTQAGIAEIVTGHGWTVDSDQDLLEVADRIGSPSRRRRSLAGGRVVVARR